MKPDQTALLEGSRSILFAILVTYEHNQMRGADDKSCDWRQSLVTNTHVVHGCMVINLLPSDWSSKCISYYAPISFFPADGDGGDNRGIRPQTNPKPQELDTSPKPLGGKLDTSYAFSKLNS